MSLYFIVCVHTDNAVYSPIKEDSFNADYQEIESVRSSRSPTNDYEVEHEYELEDELESNYYAEVGPLLDMVRSQDMKSMVKYMQLLKILLVRRLHCKLMNSFWLIIWYCVL